MISHRTILAAIGFMLGPMLTIGQAHEVKSLSGQSLGIVFPPSCCNSAATSPTGDCAPISDEYVTERADGYHINIPVGGHPKLKNKGYVGVVPYKEAKQPLANAYFICRLDGRGGSLLLLSEARNDIDAQHHLCSPLRSPDPPCARLDDHSRRPASRLMGRVDADPGD
ncbi:MAG: hypothetical protein M9939_00805 [Mesorhizobium sp.]|nr:hypothetical protein [Mesorhizobium sp.]MCO5159647.1 hypothetical protein [Mesorhizobium sp.]